MEASVTVTMAAPAQQIWDLVADVRNTGKFSPEVMEAEWLDGATGPALGAKFRGHVKRNEIGPVYWTICRVVSSGYDATSATCARRWSGSRSS
ncbi:MAG: Polyketide cyclase / dehydrase and lipid transport [Mycobacterium sp.]|jgi:hypothetical protein|nr:Polyketide cyclase / dehydrase and lipid transport [Mycobacterium sp.]